MKYSFFDTLFPALEIPAAAKEAIEIFLLFAVTGLVAIIVTYIVRKTVLALITKWLQGNRHAWDDPLASNRLFSKISWLVPFTLFSLAIDTFLTHDSSAYLVGKRLVTSGFVIVGVMTISALFSTINDVHRILRKKKGTSLRGYTDAGKIIAYTIGAIFIVSIFTGKSPWGILSVLGGLMAVVLLVFRDTILGFVASVQMASNDMVRIGDWIEMPQYGADGDVIDISIAAVKVQNWDKTITTIPPYALVSNAVKNWRGMSESGGRRIKRSISIDMQSIRFCDQEMLKELSKIDLISKYVKEKQQEIEEDNAANCGDGDPCLLNGRRQTNIGVFRAYVIAYLKNNPNIHEKMTFLVRQLAPNEHGLPLEIYVFSKDQVWAHYEAIQADIFDHLLAALPHFGLRVFQAPSGHDFQVFGSRAGETR